MELERHYIRQFLSEAQNQTKKFEENNNFLYAYTTGDRAMDGGWATAPSIKKLKDNWDDDYGPFEDSEVLVMKPATSVDKAMVLSAEPNTGGDVIYPSIDAAINGPSGLIELGWEEGATLTHVTKDEIQELLQTKDLKRAEEILRKTFVDAQDFGYFDGLYEYVSGPMPEEDGMTPGEISTPNQTKSKTSSKDLNYYERKLKSNEIYISKVPDELKTPELCKIAVESNDDNFQFVPDELKTPELCKIALKLEGANLRYVPDKLKTSKLCKIAVAENGFAIKYVPKEFITPELCKIAVEHDGYALKYVPDKFKTPELCKIALENDHTGYVPIYVPDEIKKELNLDGKEQQ